MKILRNVFAVTLMFIVCCTTLSVPASAAAKIHLNKSSVVVSLGDSYTFKLLNENNNQISNKKITWNSSDSKVAKVSQNGKTTAVKTGTATIKAKYLGKTYKCNVTVKSPKLKYSNKTLYTGKKFTQILISHNGKKISTSKIKWTSSNKKVAAVSKSGTITAKSKGKATITAKYLGKSFKCIVTVKSKSSGQNNSEYSSKVWIPTNGGTKYHSKSSCSKMKNPQCVTKNQAINQGFEPCKRCY